MTPKKWHLFYFFHIFFILTQKVLIRLLLYLTCKLLLYHEIEGRCEPRWATQVVNERSPSLLITVEARRTCNRRSPPKMIALKLKHKVNNNPLISPEFPINMEVVSVTLLLLKRYYKIYIIVSPVRSTYGGYYGLVVVTPPRPRPHIIVYAIT